MYNDSFQNMESVNKCQDKIGNLVNDAYYLQQR